METKQFNQLLQKAKDDPKFLHDLVFNAEKTIDQLDFLDRKSKGAIVALNPDQLIAVIAGELSVSGCDVTCTSSCGATCNQSCGYTTNIVDRPDLRGIFASSMKVF